MKSGREREVARIVEYDRAVEVARLLLGKLDGPMKPIFHQQYSELPRRQLKSGAHSIRDERARELQGFCTKNFEGAKPRDLANLYEELFSNGSQWRLPLTRLIELVGQPRENVLKGAPFHATVSLSPWGLQSEYPEMHLVNDLGVAFNTLLGAG